MTSIQTSLSVSSFSDDMLQHWHAHDDDEDDDDDDDDESHFDQRGLLFLEQLLQHCV